VHTTRRQLTALFAVATVPLLLVAPSGSADARPGTDRPDDRSAATRPTYGQPIPATSSPALPTTGQPISPEPISPEPAGPETTRPGTTPPGSARSETAPAGGTSTWCADHSSLVVLGDSGSTGLGMADYPRNTEFYAPTHNGWAARVARNSAAEWGTQTTVVARNGARVSDYLPEGRWPETRAAVDRIRQLQPSMVIVELGGNDFFMDKTPEQFDTEYRRLITDIKTASPRTTVLLTVIWELGVRESQTAVNPWSAYASKIGDAARANGAALIDLRQYIPKGGSLASAGYFLDDEVHLTAPGQGTFGAALWTLLWAAC